MPTSKPIRVDRLDEEGVDLVRVAGQGQQVQPPVLVEEAQHAARQHVVDRGSDPVAHRRVELGLEPHELQAPADLALAVRLNHRGPEAHGPMVSGWGWSSAEVLDRHGPSLPRRDAADGTPR